MSTRASALDALRRGLDDHDLRARLGFGKDAVSTQAVASRIVVSKVYPPSTSWTRRWSWWHQLPEDKLAGEGSLLLLCEARKAGFHLIAPPRIWLRENRNDLSWSVKQQRFNLFLSADEADLFMERRGVGLSFARCLVGTLP